MYPRSVAFGQRVRVNVSRGRVEGGMGLWKDLGILDDPYVTILGPGTYHRSREQRKPFQGVQMATPRAPEHVRGGFG